MSFDDDSPHFTSGTRLGMVFIVEAAALSICAVTGLLLYIAYSAVPWKNGSKTWSGSTHIHYYFVNLLVCDLIQAIGGILNIQWVMDAAVSEGTLCTAQAIMKQMGDVGVACTTMAIAIHTFLVLVFRRNSAPRTALIVIAAIWVFIALAVGISFAKYRHDYYGVTQYWCWITSDFTGERIGLEYFWLWSAAFVNLVCYIVVALVIKGIFVVNGTRMRMTREEDRRSIAPSILPSAETHQTNIALQMLFYPVVYIITVLPVAVVRFSAFSGKDVPFPATAFASILFSLSGFFNVLLFKLTRPKILPTRPISMLPTHDHHRFHSQVFQLSISSRPTSGQWNCPSHISGESEADSWKFLPRSPATVPQPLHIPSPDSISRPISLPPVLDIQ